jgi:ribosomal protein S18 acetylase RimI-like enzyme
MAMKSTVHLSSETRPLPAAHLHGKAPRPGHTLITIRQATRDDCARIARLFMIASDGVAEYIWSRVEAPDLSLLEIGKRRYAREGTAFSYQNCLVAEKNGAVIAMLHSFPMHKRDDDEYTVEVDPVLAPYSALEDCGSLYVSAVAVFHEHRRLGIGTRLLEEARRRARALGLDRLSLICFEKNTKALRLYQRLGFRELRRRAIVPHPFLHYREGDAILLACPCENFNVT